MKKYVIGILLIMLFFIVGCTKEEEINEGKSYTIYYLSPDSTNLVTKEYCSDVTETDALIEELKTELLKSSKKLEYVSPFGNTVSLRKLSCRNGRLLLDFEANYGKLPADMEVLTRAAIVKTFIQIEGIHYISFQVEGKDLEDNMGKLVGPMYEESFIYNEGAQINSFEKKTINLYFANDKGDKLIKSEKTVMYNTNVAMERMILEQLIAGPKDGKTYPTLNSDTKVLSVVVKDNVCYANLSSSFLNSIYNVSSEVVIYSIVNSLCQITGINKVQILVDGDSGFMYREKMSLNALYEFNKEILDAGMKN